MLPIPPQNSGPTEIPRPYLMGWAELAETEARRRARIAREAVLRSGAIFGCCLGCSL